MNTPLPELAKIEIKQDTSLPDEAALEAFEAIIWLMDDKQDPAMIQTAPAGIQSMWTRIERKRAAHPEGKSPIFMSLDDARTALLRLSADTTGFKALQLARQTLDGLLPDRPRSIAVLTLIEPPAASEQMAEAIVAALHAALFPLPRLGKAGDPPAPVGMLHFFGVQAAPDFNRAEATAEGNNLARWLTHMPPSHLSPEHYRTLATELGRREGWKSRFLDRRQLEKLGAGAFLSVVAASPRDDAGILKLEYRPAGCTGKPLALVGKGICFDTGGTNLKNATGMLGMHGDMQGSAVALGTLLALTRLGFPFPVDCWLALAENHIGSRAAKCNDVVTAANGTTIEIINTDAEGRMVLADTLALASREEPRAILDYATLTGSCVAALGDRMSGAISNRPDWTGAIIEAGERSGERVWPLPYAEDYDQDLESGVADTLQCRAPGEADHLYAARFLGRFVNPDIDWVHIDLSSGNRKGGLGHIPTDVIGFGVRFGVEWLHFVTES